MSHPTRKVYYATFAALLVLLVLTVGVSFLDLGVGSALAAMTIAVGKAVLIVLFFMHVRYEVPLVRVFAISGFLWLALLLAFMMSDYLTRTGVQRAERGESAARSADSPRADFQIRW